MGQKGFYINYHDLSFRYYRYEQVYPIEKGEGNSSFIKESDFTRNLVRIVESYVCYNQGVPFYSTTI